MHNVIKGTCGKYKQETSQNLVDPLRSIEP